MEEKLISVIVPIYNVETLLRRCIDSIINQTYHNLEIILVDDGSTDKCGLICDEYKRIDNRIIVIHKENEGLSSARNEGLRLARGQYIGFVDSDDYIDKTMYFKLKKNMDDYNSDISICSFLTKKKLMINGINEKNKEFVLSGKDKYYNLYNKMSNIIVVAWNKLYKKEMFNNIFYPNGKIYEDSFVIIKLLNNANRISFILEPLYFYSYRRDSISHTFSKHSFDRIDSFNSAISFYNNIGYHDFIKKENTFKMNTLIILLSKMKCYKINDKSFFNKYYNELVSVNKKVNWKDATKLNKFYKLFRKLSLIIISYMIRIKDSIGE